jgi:serine O-acetyltransferase
VGRRVAIDHQSGIVIHGNTVIGDECRIRHNTTMGLRSVDDLAAAPTLESGVDVGVGAVIIGRITIGTGAVIGAGAIVLDDVPPGAVAVGTPAAVRPRSTATTRDSASDR